MILLFTVIWSVAATALPGTYFCTTKGATLRYERYDCNSGKHWWTQTTRIDDIKYEDDGSRSIKFTANIKSDKVQAPVKGDVSSTAIIRPDGTVEVNITEAVSIAAGQRLSAFNFKATGGMSSMKSTVKPGDKLDEIHGAVNWKGIKYTLDYTDRSVLRRETITVPAGTFECIVVKEHKVESAPFYKRDRITLSWYALDYGVIKHDSFFPDGRQECSEQLYEIR